MDRLRSSAVDAQQSEITANEATYSDMQANFVEAAHEYHNIRQSGNWIQIYRAKRAFEKQEKKWEAFKKGFKRLNTLSARDSGEQKKAA